MNRIVIIVYIFLFVVNTNVLLAQAVDEPVKQSKLSTYKNPLPVAFGDPYVLHVKGDKYYMYGTGGGAKHGFSAYSSTDLVNWKKKGRCILATIKMAGAALIQCGTALIGRPKYMK